MSKKHSMIFQSPSIKSSNNTIIWNNNNINGNININNNYSSENMNMINPIKKSGAVNFKNSNSSIVSQNYNNHFKQIKIGGIIILYQVKIKIIKSK